MRGILEEITTTDLQKQKEYCSRLCTRGGEKTQKRLRPHPHASSNPPTLQRVGEDVKRTLQAQ